MSRLPKLSRPVVLGVASTLAILIGVGAFAARQAANAAEPLRGNRVSAADVRILVRAASSCSALTPARLAGQVMATSNFGSQPVPAMRDGGRTGIAALTPEQWRKYAPQPDASPADREAGITALAHATCQFVGQARAVKIAQDPWRVALAAYRVGMDQVIAAGDIPSAAGDYVDTAERYATWYALQPAFGGGPASPAPSATAGGAVLPVPDQYVSAVVAAGKVCADMPPARIAAQIMATSGFDPRKLGPTGEQGIAQFRPQTWLAYAPSAASRTPWDPAAAIPALGKAMCALVRQASGAYGTALAAFVRGGSREPVTALAGAVADDQAEYAKDTRLRAATAPSTGKPRPHAGSAPPSSSATPTPPPSVRANQPPVKAADKSTYGPYFIYNFATKECVDLPAFGATSAGDPVTQYPCAKTGTDNQEFAFVPRTTDGSGDQLYWIKNTDSGLCVDPPGVGTVGSGTVLSEIACLDNDNQYFRLELRFASGGFEYYWLRDTVAGEMCLDVPGKAVAGPDARLALVPCLEHDDHEWALVQKSEW